jgi:thiol-disulfide isomerase/thioredoxin
MTSKDTIHWLDMKEGDLLTYIQNSQRLKDSIAHVVFDKTPLQDKYLKYFGSMVRLDNLFNRLYMLIAYVNWNSYNHDKSIALVRDHFDNKVLGDLYRDDYLISYTYRTWIVGGEWVDYLVRLDHKKDSTLKKQSDYPLQKISTTFRGKVKDFALFDQLNYAITYTNSFDELTTSIAQYEAYGAGLENEHYKKTLLSKIAAKKELLLRAQVGKPAPSFTLQSNQGITHSLVDFKGKVVYLDLWASWCTPCREETPSMQALYNKYKNDNRIAIIGIGVQDGMKQWEKAIQEDKPEWLQLLDKDGAVVKAYTAYEIPRFILIDKEGRIVDFNAPRPSSGKEIESLLNQEMEK